MQTTAIQIKERPILFSGPMVRAILDGRKTQTRREVKNIHPDAISFHGFDTETNEAGFGLAERVLSRVKCPYGKPGARLWVRESFFMDCENIAYRADHDGYSPKDTPWKPSIHMPRVASRILFEITDIRMERLWDISESDAFAEGVQKAFGPNWRNYAHENYTCGNAKASFLSLWESINGPKSLGENPWVWAITFKRI
jgi:hypothetical protein